MPDFSVDTILKLPDSQKLGIIAVTIAVIIGAYVYFIHLPARETLQQRNDEITKLQAKYNEQLKVLADLPKFKKEYKDLEVKFKESLKLLPNTREIPSLLTNISNLASNCGLEILLFQPKPEIEKDFYAEIPVEMKVLGKYHNVGYFFDKVSKLNRIVNINDTVIQSQKGKKNTRTTLEAKFKAVTFKFIEKDKASGKKKKNRRRRR